MTDRFDDAEYLDNYAPSDHSTHHWRDCEVCQSAAEWAKRAATPVPTATFCDEMAATLRPDLLKELQAQTAAVMRDEIVGVLYAYRRTFPTLSDERAWELRLDKLLAVLDPDSRYSEAERG